MSYTLNFGFQHPFFTKKLMMVNDKWPSQLVLVIKKPPANAGDIRDAGSSPGLSRSPGGGHGNPLQYSCLGNPMDRGAWQATVHRVTESDMTEMT